MSSGANYLFTPRTTYRVRRAGGVGGGIADEGTPIQPEEPQAPNPPLGMYVDYYLHGSPSTPVVIEILGPRGAVLRKYSSADKPERTSIPTTQEIAPRWIPAAGHLSTPIRARIASSGISRRVTTEGHSHLPDATPCASRSVARPRSQQVTLARDPRINVTDKALARSIHPLQRHRRQDRADRRGADARASVAQIGQAQCGPDRAFAARGARHSRGRANPDDSVGETGAPTSPRCATSGSSSNFCTARCRARMLRRRTTSTKHSPSSRIRLDGTIAKLASIAGPK